MDRLAAARTRRSGNCAYPVRDRLTRSRRFQVIVHRQRALYGAWYEFFPRSEGVQIDPHGAAGADAGHAAHRGQAAGADRRHGLRRGLPAAGPPDRRHRPQGAQQRAAGGARRSRARRGRSARRTAGTTRSTRISGTLDDFDAFVGRARRAGPGGRARPRPAGSPDHPWVTEHPEWFTTRADGTIAYAENPPKKYQDIYPINFDNDPEGLYAEALRIVRHWMDHGVRIFRVDNPHTKPLPFWERLLAEVDRTDPDVIFLAEAFTRPGDDAHPGQDRLPPVLHLLHLAQHRGRAHRVPAASWPGRPPPTCGPTSSPTPRTSCTSTCSTAGRRAFKVRAVLAAMLSPSWGIYSGYELCENVAAPAGQRGVPGLGEVPVPAAGLGRGGARAGRHRAVHHPAQRDQEEPTRRCTGCVICASTTSTSRT